MSRLASDRLLRPRDIVDSELGVGLAYPLDDRFQRLDLWLADHPGSVPAESQLRLLREVAEAVSYAHGSRVVHRGLTPHAAADRAGLRERLHRENGLDLAADLPQVPSAVRALVLEATRPAVTERLPDVRSFLARLAAAEAALAGPDEEVIDPLEAVPGSVIDGRFRLERRLGRGSTAVGLLVTDLAIGTAGPDAARVLKVAVDDGEVPVIEMTEPRQVAEVVRDPITVRLGQCPLGDIEAIVPAADDFEHLVMPGRQQHQAHPVGARAKALPCCPD